MGWKKYPTWIRGGIIATSISVVSSILTYVFEIFEESLANFEILRTIVLILGAPISLLGWIFIWGDNGSPLPLTIELILGFLLWFLIGAVIGLIVYKIKSRNK